MTAAITIKRSVRQGCVLSPLLEAYYDKGLDDIDEGILKNDECVNNIRYADNVPTQTVKRVYSIVSGVTEVI